MKLKYLFSLVFLATLLACEDEKNLTPRSSDAASLSRFEFPQGNNSWDRDLEEIANTLKTILVYTAFDSLDLNQRCSGTYTISRLGETLDDEYAAFYADFFKNHIFAFLEPNLLTRVLPNYIYLVDDLRQKGSWTYGYTPLACLWDGLDYWAFSFRAKEENLAVIDYGNGFVYKPYKPYDLPKGSWEYKVRRTVILQNVETKIVEKGNVAIPVEFESGGDFDYSKSFSSSMTADNYFKKLGYLGQMTPTSYNFSNPSGKMTVQTNFTNYLKLGLRYTRDSVLIVYPPEQYPLIIKYYDFTMKYLKDKYGWDLVKAAELIAVKEN